MGSLDSCITSLIWSLVVGTMLSPILRPASATVLQSRVADARTQRISLWINTSDSGIDSSCSSLDEYINSCPASQWSATRSFFNSWLYLLQNIPLPETVQFFGKRSPRGLHPRPRTGPYDYQWAAATTPHTPVADVLSHTSPPIIAACSLLGPCSLRVQAQERCCVQR